MKTRKELKSNQSNTYNVFKFRDIDKYLIDSLIMGTIYFSAPDKLNDPFDCKLDIRKAIENAAKHLSKQGLMNDSEKLYALLKNNRLFEYLQMKINSIGICSFSLSLKNVLLWSHYSNKHKGVAILYEFPKDFLTDGESFIGMSEVYYTNNPLKDWFTRIANQLPIKDDDLSIKLAKIIFTSKNPNWKYEKEVRIIRQKPGLLKIEKGFIKQICFGLATPNEDIALIKEITSNYKEKVQLFRAIRGSNDFWIGFKKI